MDDYDYDLLAEQTCEDYDYDDDYDDNYDYADHPEYFEVMDGDHESALESVYGPSEDGMCDRDWE
jgi:hypothetical protein